eukprot:m.218920 g.218920  ORF g.218920 m.218920 type:complete len:1393 (+) comp39915_c0_seq7:688-4866(+)
MSTKKTGGSVEEGAERMSSSSAVSLVAAGIHPPAPFLPCPGAPPIPWKTWITAFDTYLLASGLAIADAFRKRALLLHCLGVEGQRVFETLGTAESYDGARTMLADYFGPHLNVMAERYRFHLRSQRQGESVREYVSALSALASTCRFGVLRDELIRDQLVFRTAHLKVREQLLLKPDTISCREAVDLATLIEEAIKESRVIGGRALGEDQEVQMMHTEWGSVNRIEEAHNGSLCPNCAWPTHAPGVACPAQGKQCRKCKKSNHFGRCCRSSGSRWQSPLSQRRSASSSQQPQSAGSSEPRVERLHMITDASDVLSVTVEKVSPFKVCECLVGGKRLPLVMDLGAKVSVINMNTFRKMWPGASLVPSSVQLRNYGGSSIPVEGTATLSVNCDDTSVKDFPFVVTPVGADVMGVDLFDALGFRVVRDVRLKAPTSSEPPAPVFSVGEGPSDENRRVWRQRYPNVFSGIGEVDGFEHEPLVDGSVKPVMQSLRRLPLALRSEVSAELDRLLREGVIERVESSPWISNIVIVRKKSGALRLCVGLQVVNKAIIPGKYPLPTLEEMASEFAGSTWFSKLDLRQGYLQVPLAKESRYLTAFVSHDGVFQFRRLPFGLSSAPSAFQRMMKTVLMGASGTVVYLDDIVVHAASKEVHDERLAEVLRRLERVHLTVNEEKCEFGARRVEFMGYGISSDGVSPLRSPVEAIVSVPPPTTVKELKSFLGVTNYYLRFIRGYADLTEPLRRLVKKDVPWDWSSNCQKAFQALKAAITSAPTLAHFATEATTVVSCDASSFALGAVLSQVIDGEERPVAFASRALSPTERKYAVEEREALACLWACERWDMYLYGRRFTLRTDHQALVALLSTGGSGRRPLRLHRWADRLMQYNFHMVYRPGKENRVADALSRTAEKDPDGGDGETVMILSAETEEEASLIQMMSAELQNTVTVAELEEESKASELLSRVVECVQSGWPSRPLVESLKPFYRLRDELSVWGRRSACLARGERAIVPESLRERVLASAHEGHLGIVKMKQKCRSAVWWPGLDREIEEMAKNCEACQLSGKLRPREAPLQPVVWPRQPGSEIQVDIFGEVKAAPADQRFLIVIHDLHSKWPEVKAYPSVAAAVIVDFMRELFARWGIPDSVTTDNGPQFVSYEFGEFLRGLGIRHNRTSFYHPQANGAVERFNQVLKQGLKAYWQEGQPMNLALQRIVAAYRTAEHSLTGRSPAELMLGRLPRTSLSALRPPGGSAGLMSPETEAIAQVIEKRQEKQRQYTDKKRSAVSPQLVPGDWVRVKRPQRGHKLKSLLSAPFRIEKRLAKASYQLSDATRWHARNLVKIPAPAEGWITRPEVGGEPEISQSMAVAQSEENLGDFERESPVQRPQRRKFRPLAHRDYEVKYYA